MNPAVVGLRRDGPEGFPVKQIFRDSIEGGELTLEYFAKRFGEGWRVRSIEWFREADQVTTEERPANVLGAEPVLPFGLRVTEAGLVEESPLETTVLLLVLEQIIRERRIQEIAGELNAQGYATREGTPWSATDIFNLLPRVIEAGPSILKSEAWRLRRPGVQSGSSKAH